MGGKTGACACVRELRFAKHAVQEVGWNVHATVISHTRNGTRVLAKEWECSFDRRSRRKARRTKQQALNTSVVTLFRAFSNRLYLRDT